MITLWIGILLLIAPVSSWAAVTQVSCSSSATVQNGLNDAANGDTIQCASGGSFSWSTISIPGTKNITLDGNGATITSGLINIPSSASYSARVTNFTFRSDNVISTGDGFTNKPWRLDHCTFNASGTSLGAMINTHTGPGLIDNCNFTNIPVAKETIHNLGWGAGSYTGWSNDHTPGSANALYIEDCTATGAQGNSSCLIQNYYGARIVVRYNKLIGAMVDAHGNNTQYSARWWELYNNTITNSSVFCLRGGSGIIFGNAGTHTAFFINETSDNRCGIGDGKNEVLYPAYLWNNGTSYSYNQDGCSVHNGTVNWGTDVVLASSGTTLPTTCTVNQSYWKTNEGGNWDTTHGGDNDGLLYKCTATNTWTAYYTPYTYPHPLRGEGSPSVEVPSNLRLQNNP
jgi:hypothetical protein